MNALNVIFYNKFWDLLRCCKKQLSKKKNHQKKAMVSSLVDRAVELSDHKYHNGNFSILSLNFYPHNFVYKSIKRRLYSTIYQNNSQIFKINKTVNYIVLPFSEKIQYGLTHMFCICRITIVLICYSNLNFV